MTDTTKSGNTAAEAQNQSQNQITGLPANVIERPLTLNSIFKVPEIGLHIIDPILPPNLTYAVLPEFRPELATSMEGQSTLGQVPAGWRPHRRVQKLSETYATYKHIMPNSAFPTGTPVYLEHSPADIDSFRPHIALEVLRPLVDANGDALIDNEAEGPVKLITPQSRRLAVTATRPLLLHVVNFGSLNPQQYRGHIDNCAGIVYQCPTWDRRDVERYPSLLDSVPLLRCWVIGSVIYVIAGPEEVFDEVSFWYGIFTRQPDALRRLEAVANQNWILPPPMFRADHSEACVARQIWIRNRGTVGQALDTHALGLIIARKLNEPNGRVHVVAARLEMVIDGNLSNYSRYRPYTPWEIDQRVSNYFNKIGQGQQPIQALQLLGQAERRTVITWCTARWAEYLQKVRRRVGTQGLPDAYWNNNLSRWAGIPVYIWHHARGGGQLRKVEARTETTPPAPAGTQHDQIGQESEQNHDAQDESCVVS